MDIKINCHSSICVNGEIWFDPFRVDNEGSAKLLFVTHPSRSTPSEPTPETWFFPGIMCISVEFYANLLRKRTDCNRKIKKK